MLFIIRFLSLAYLSFVTCLQAQSFEANFDTTLNSSSCRKASFEDHTPMSTAQLENLKVTISKKSKLILFSNTRMGIQTKSKKIVVLGVNFHFTDPRIEIIAGPGTLQEYRFFCNDGSDTQICKAIPLELQKNLNAVTNKTNPNLECSKKLLQRFYALAK